MERKKGGHSPTVPLVREINGGIKLDLPSGKEA